MKLNLLFIFALFLSSMHGQQFNVGDQDGFAMTDSRLQNFITDLTNNVGKYNKADFIKSIKGSAYFDEKFIQGKVHYMDKSVTNKDRRYFRYKAGSEEIEMGLHPNQKIAEEALLKNHKISCTFGGNTYYYRPYVDKQKKIQLGYLISVFKGEKYHLFQQQRKIYREATVPRTSLERAFPARFTNEINYFLGINDNTPFFLGNDFREIIKNFPSEIKNTARKKEISVKKIKSRRALINLFERIN